MRFRLLTIQRGVPVLAAGHKDTIDLTQDLPSLIVVVYLGQIHGVGAIALESLSKILIGSTISTPRIIALPRYTNNRPLVHIGNLDLRNVPVLVKPQVCCYRIPEVARTNRRPQLGFGFVGHSHHCFQFFYCANVKSGIGAVKDFHLRIIFGGVDYIVV